MLILKELEPFTRLLTTVAVGVILVIFRTDVGRLVSWVVGFRRIQKTKEGYALESAAEPEPPPLLLAEKKEQAIAAVEAVLPPATTVSATATTSHNLAERWITAIDENRYDDAVRLLQAEYEKTSDPDQRLTFKSVIGYVTFQQGPPQGIQYFEQLIQESPTKPQPYQWFALTYLWKDLPEKALAILDRGLSAVDSRAVLLDTKSDSLARLGRVDEAIAAAKQGVEAQASFTASYLNLAKLYEKKGDVPSARSWYKKALDASHGSDNVIEAYARFLSTHNSPAETIRWFRELVLRQPKNSTYVTLLGNAYLDAGYNSLALQAYMTANEYADGKEGWILANIGNILKNRDFYSEAVKYLKRAVECDADSQYAHERLAQAQKLDAEESEKLMLLLDQARATDVLPEPPDGAA